MSNPTSEAFPLCSEPSRLPAPRSSMSSVATRKPAPKPEPEPDAPKGKEKNWLPTVPNKKFFLIFRFYRPEPALFNKSWKLNDVEKLK